jgi:hypothetical protein
MRCRFTASPAGGIRLIDEIADYQLCRLEGRNGIGKTLAVRLLELATGGAPYASAPAAWRSLRQHLGPVQIVVNSLRDGDELELHLVPNGWPDEQPRDLASLGMARLNGQQIDFQKVPDLLHVVRIGGDEDIISEFKQVIAADARVVEDQNTRLGEEIERIGVACDRILRDTAELSPHRLDELVSLQEGAVKRRAALKDEYGRHEGVVSRLEQLEHQIHTLSELEEQGPAIEEELAGIETALGEVARRREMQEEQRRLLLPDAERHRELLAQLQRLERKRDQQAERAREADARAKDALAQLGLSVDSDSAAIREAEKRARRERSELLHGQTLLRVPPDLIALIKQLRLPLDPLGESSLDEEEVAIIAQQRITVSELRVGLDRREAELSEQQQHALIEETEAEIKEVGVHLRELRSSLRLLDDARGKAEDLQQVETEAREVAHALATRHDDEYQQVVIALEHLQNEGLEHINRRAELRYRHGVLERAGSAEKLAREIAELRDDLSVTGSPITALENVRNQLADCRAKLQVADEQERLTTVNLREFERHVDERVGVLERSPEYAWLRSAVGDLLPTTRDERLRSLEQMARLDDALRRFQSGMDTLANRAARALEALQRLTRPRESTGEVDGGYLIPLANHYAKRFGELLSDRDIQSALFGDGRFSRLDLLNWELIWETANGEPQRRPLQAFSSGERAFAYVLASILRHTGQSAPNSMLVLDEFGAFIEADRLARLLHFLGDQVLAPGRADQVVIILPLRETVKGLVSEEQNPRARAIAERGYVMESVPVEVTQ